MICLTGDIHHHSLKLNEQRYIKDPDDSEVKISCRYLKLVEKYKLKATFYVTGKTLEEEWEDFKPIAASKIVEIGGHTYEGLPRTLFSQIWAKITGKPDISHSFSHGTYANQKKDIQKMIEIVKKRIGKDLVSWRSHGLVVDKNTYKILAEAGIKCISDDLNWHKLFPEKIPEGLISHSINVIMDHDHIYHAHRTKEYVENQKKYWTYTNDPTKESYPIEKWGDIVEKQVLEIERKNGIATVLMHPLCQYLSDRFKTAGRLFKIFSQYKTIWAKEVPF